MGIKPTWLVSYPRANNEKSSICYRKIYNIYAWGMTYRRVITDISDENYSLTYSII